MSKTDLALPWTYDGHDHYFDSGGRYRNILDANGNEVTGEYSNVSHEEAEFIVRAVNSYDMLVAALELAQKGLDQVGKQDSFIDYEFNDRVIKSVKAALAAVETKNNTEDD